LRNPGRHRVIHRYGPYFEGWAQAFGAHQRIDEPELGLRWLVGDDQLGVILTEPLRKQLRPGLLNRPEAEEQPVVRALSIPWFDSIDSSATAIHEHLAAWSERIDSQAQSLHLYQTYHLVYPAGTRILTLSTRAPMALIYRELTPLPVAAIRRD
jgi:hypothetical protein